MRLREDALTLGLEGVELLPESDALLLELSLPLVYLRPLATPVGLVAHDVLEVLVLQHEVLSHLL